MILRLSLILLIGALGASAPAQGSSINADVVLCRNSELEPPLRVEACARALAAPDLTQRLQLDLLSARAQALDDLGDHGRAIEDYDSAIILAPKDPVLRLNRGVAKMHDGRPAAAIEDYDEAARLKPDWHLPYFDRAVALSDLGQRAAALKDYERAIRLKPDDAWIYVGQGDVLAASGDPVRALAAYDKALSLRPDLGDPRAKRARMLLRLDRPAEALPELDRVLALNPSKPRLWQERGEAKFQLARYADAAADFGRALALAPGDPDARRDLARAKLGAGDPEGAWRILAPAVVAEDSGAPELTIAAMAALLTGRNSAADTLSRRAIAAKPGEAAAHAILALRLRHGSQSDAASHAALAASFAPADPDVLATARFLGTGTDGQRTAPLVVPRTTPAKAALADCVAHLAAGELDAARAAAADWSLCHLAAVLGR